MGWVSALHNGAIRTLIGRVIAAGVCIRYSTLLPLGNSSGVQIHPLSLRVPHGRTREKCSPENLAYKYSGTTAPFSVPATIRVFTIPACVHGCWKSRYPEPAFVCNICLGVQATKFLGAHLHPLLEKQVLVPVGKAL